jgi:hypothetical protein
MQLTSVSELHREEDSFQTSLNTELHGEENSIQTSLKTTFYPLAILECRLCLLAQDAIPSLSLIQVCLCNLIKTFPDKCHIPDIYPLKR